MSTNSKIPLVSQPRAATHSPVPHIGLQGITSLAVSRLRAGTLPCDIPPRLLAGPGQNESCSLCEQPIVTGDVEYEVSALHQGQPQSFYFHITCYHAWVRACRSHTGSDLSTRR